MKNILFESRKLSVICTVYNYQVDLVVVPIVLFPPEITVNYSGGRALLDLSPEQFRTGITCNKISGSIDIPNIPITKTRP
jgi:hypothetical protein